MPVSHELRENVRNSVQDDLCTPASDLLHRPPDGTSGNLQLSFFVRDGDWMAEVDIPTTSVRS